MKHKNSKRHAQNESRRTALKTLMTGGGFATLSALPAQWVKPVVDAVMLPVHAQTSAAPNGKQLTPVRGRSAWWEGIVPSAHAGLLGPNVFLCIESTGAGTYAASLNSLGGTVLTASASIGDCTPLLCVSAPIASLRVTAKNEDGSFDFIVYSDPACSKVFASGTTDTPCNVQPGNCEL